MKAQLERIQLYISALKISNAKVWEISDLRRGIWLTLEEGTARAFRNVDT